MAKVFFDDILANIVDEKYALLPDGRTTVCQLTLVNGFTVTGTSACIDPANFDAKKGENFAREEAIENCWEPLGAVLADRVADRKLRMRDSDDLRVMAAAKAAHEINRAYCQALGDNSQVAWEDAPLWQQNSAVNGVKFRLANPFATPEDMHNSWMEQKRQEGWVYGEEKCEAAKTHPCFVPYNELPAEQRVKDYLFSAAVRAALEL